MTTAGTAVVMASDLQFQWRPRDGAVLDIPRLGIERGERVFIEGPSGSGKTTLLSLIAGVITPSAGTLTVLGTDLAALPGRRRDGFRNQHIGLVFQMFNLIPYLSLVENVLLPCRFSAARRDRASNGGGTVAEEARRLLHNLDLDVAALSGRPVSRLSTGQQQRVAVARALIGRPELIICDEPTSALDGASRTRFLDLLFQEVAACGASLVFASHDQALADRFDRRIDLPAINRAARPTG